MIVTVALAIAGTALAYRFAMISTGSTAPAPAQVLRHVLNSLTLTLAVLSLSALLRRAQRPAWAALISWTVILTPALAAATEIVQGLNRTGAWAELIALARHLQTPQDGAHLALSPFAAGLWWIAAHPGWPAAIGLLVADGVRSTWTRWSFAVALLAAGTVIGLGVYRPATVHMLTGWELGPMQSLIAGMVLTSALTASSAALRGGRWLLALGAAIPVVLTALVPTMLSDVLTGTSSLTLQQRWSIVLLPAAALAGTALGALHLGIRRVGRSPGQRPHSRRAGERPAVPVQFVGGGTGQQPVPQLLP